MPEERRIEPGEIHPRFWDRTVREAFKNDPLRIAIELIKNSADSYTRLNNRGHAKPPFKIYVKLFCRKNSLPLIEVLDNAEGMDSTKLREALKYGTQTSMGEDANVITSAEKGIGLKDAMMALEDNWLITVKDRLTNERKKHRDFKTGFGREDEPINEKEGRELGILKNGTLVRGRFPEYFRIRRFSTICDRLQQHFLMRKMLEQQKFRIYAIDGNTDGMRLLQYVSPKIEKEILNEAFEIEYNRKKYKIHLLMNRSTEQLNQGKPFGKSGLLFFYGEYSVVDLTFSRFEKDLSFSKNFGEVRMKIEEIIRDQTESPLVDEKRRGLDRDHPFNKKLFKKIDSLLEEAHETEDSEYSLDETTKKEILRELNRIYKDIKGRGPPPPIRPATFAFYPVYVSLNEYETRSISLIINSSIVLEDFDISLRSTNRNIIIRRPRKIIIKKKPREEFIIRQFELYSETPGEKGEIIASSLSYLFDTAKMGVEVLQNPIFSPANGFAFVPEKTTIVDGGKKKVGLCIEKATIEKLRRIIFASSGPITCPGEWLLPHDEERLREYVIKNIVKIPFPINVKGTGHIGEKANIEASYDGKNSNLTVTVVPEPSIAGIVRDIRFSPKETRKVCGFIREEGILEVYYNHPLVKKYMVKEFNTRSDFLVFIADSITREALSAIVTSAVEGNLSRFPIFDMDHPQDEIEKYVNGEYYENGTRMHEMFIQLAKTLKIGE